MMNPPKLDIESLLAVGSLTAFTGALAVVLFFVVPASNEKYVMLLLGALIGVVKDTFGRYFQATKGAQEQRQDFAELAKVAATAPVVHTQDVQVVNKPDEPVPTTVTT